MSHVSHTYDQGRPDTLGRKIKVDPEGFHLAVIIMAHWGIGSSRQGACLPGKINLGKQWRSYISNGFVSPHFVCQVTNQHMLRELLALNIFVCIFVFRHFNARI